MGPQSQEAVIAQVARAQEEAVLPHRSRPYRGQVHPGKLAVLEASAVLLL